MPIEFITMNEHDKLHSNSSLRNRFTSDPFLASSYKSRKNESLIIRKTV